jgi:hypothetical protein
MRLKDLPANILTKDVKERYIKMKVGIVKRIIENQASNEVLRKWKLPVLKQEIIHMSKLDRFQLMEYKRMNNISFYKSRYNTTNSP